MIKHRISRTERRQRSEARQYLAMCAAIAIGFAAMIAGAATIDANNGLTISQSLNQHGL